MSTLNPIVYIIDDDGIVVGAEHEFSQISNLVIVHDLSGFNPAIGQPAFSLSGVAFLKTIITQIRSSNLSIKTIKLTPRAGGVDIAISRQDYYVKFFMGGDPVIQAGQYLAARHQFTKKHIQPRQYLDVRVPGKIFYK